MNKILATLIAGLFAAGAYAQAPAAAPAKAATPAVAVMSATPAVAAAPAVPGEAQGVDDAVRRVLTAA